MSECSFLLYEDNGTGDPPPITIVVNEANAEANGNLNFLADCETGACCLDPVCIQANQRACVDISSIHQGNGTSCDDPCLTDDCNGNGVLDAVDISTCHAEDCQGNGVPDSCDIALGTCQDSNGNGIPDECEGTVSAEMSCIPAMGTVPFSTLMTATLTNNYSGQVRRISAHLDLTTGNGGTFPNWRAGWTNVAAGSSRPVLEPEHPGHRQLDRREPVRTGGGGRDTVTLQSAALSAGRGCGYRQLHGDRYCAVGHFRGVY